MVYEKYLKYVENMCDKDLSIFKSHPDYTYMLEHTSKELGELYLTKILETHISISDIKEFCKLNDSIGSPDLFRFGKLDCKCSPSSLRYLYQAHLVLTHFSQCDSSGDIVEIGGGYGGLYLAIDYLKNKYKVYIKSYSIIDLPGVTKLQKIYLNLFKHDIELNFFPSTNSGSDIVNKDNYLISSYCFSELPQYLQKKYIETLFPKIKHGFFAWNNIPLFDFGFKYKLSEYICNLYGYNNMYVYF